MKPSLSLPLSSTCLPHSSLLNSLSHYLSTCPPFFIISWSLSTSHITCATQILSLSLSLSLSVSLSLYLSHSLSLTLSLPVTVTLSLYFSLSLFLFFSLFLSLSLCFSFFHPIPRVDSIYPSHNMYSLSLSLSHSSYYRMLKSLTGVG